MGERIVVKQANRSIYYTTQQSKPTVEFLGIVVIPHLIVSERQVVKTLSSPCRFRTIYFCDGLCVSGPPKIDWGMEVTVHTL